MEKKIQLEEEVIITGSGITGIGACYYLSRKNISHFIMAFWMIIAFCNPALYSQTALSPGDSSISRPLANNYFNFPGIIDSNFHDVLVKGLNHVTNNQFREALNVFTNLEKKYPDHPAPYFFLAATYQNWMINYRNNHYEKLLFENTNKAIEKGQRLLESKDDPWLHFYVGSAYGFNALHRFRQNSWISAYFDALDAVENLDLALEKEPALYDCYYGLGAYNYWRTERIGFIRFLVFWMENKQEKGLQQLKASVEKGSYCTYEATHGLIIAYFQNENYSLALKFSDMAMKFSNEPSLTTLYLHGRLMVVFERWDEAQEIFQEILDKLISQQYQSVSYQVECKYWIAVSLYRQNKADLAMDMAINALSQSKLWDKERELENPFDSFEDVVDWLDILKEKLGSNSSTKLTSKFKNNNEK